MNLETPGRKLRLSVLPSGGEANVYCHHDFAGDIGRPRDRIGAIGERFPRTETVTLRPPVDRDVSQ